MLDERWSSDIIEIGDALRKLLGAECTTGHVRRAEESADGRDGRLEAVLADFGLGDLGGDVALAARVALEVGRALAPVPFVETMPAQFVLGLDGVSYGFGKVIPASVPETVILRDDQVVVIAAGGEPRRSTAGDLVVEPRDTGHGSPVGDASAADRLRRMAALVESARLIGAGQALVEIGARYACERSQFGKQIGAYQGVAFRLVDAAIALDAADLLLRKAAYSAGADAGGDGVPALPFSLMLRAKAGDAARLAATQVHQIFGGAGFAMEYDVQLYSRRIRSWSMRQDRTGPGLAELGRLVLDPARRDVLRHLWHHDTGVPLPRWATEADRISPAARDASGGR